MGKATAPYRYDGVPGGIRTHDPLLRMSDPILTQIVSRLLGVESGRMISNLKEQLEAAKESAAVLRKPYAGPCGGRRQGNDTD